MNREIKFRAWNRDVMVYTPRSFSSWGDSLNDCLARWNEGESVLMQFTGLQDKSGKEIYEGDILKDDRADVYLVHYNLTPYPTGFIKSVADGCDAMFGLLSRKYFAGVLCSETIDGTNLKVIGNIYENPDLLENKITAQEA